MTLCIGAICEQDDRPRIVLCSDWQQETPFAGGEVSDKLKWLDTDHKWAALVADSVSRGFQLVDTLRKHFKTKTSIGDDEIFSFLEAGLALHKVRLSDEFFKLNYGVSFDEVLSNGSEGAQRRFPDRFVEESLQKLESVKFGAQVIVAGFAEGDVPALFIINEDPYSPNATLLRRDENFAAIGSGAPSALMTLYRRKHIGTEISLLRAMYHLFEAMVMSGEVVPGVGKEDMSIDVLSPSGPPLSLSDSGYSYLSRRFDADFGPRSIGDRNRFNFSEKYVESFEFDWREKSEM